MDLFVYGTLMDEAVRRALALDDRAFTGARLADHAAFRVDGEAYPGLVEAPGRTAAGLVLHGISARDMQRLDRFEGEAYERVIVIATLDTGEATPCAAYLFKDRDDLTEEAWSLVSFRKNGRDAFLQGYRGFEQA